MAIIITSGISKDAIVVIIVKFATVLVSSQKKIIVYL